MLIEFCGMLGLGKHVIIQFCFRSFLVFTYFACYSTVFVLYNIKNLRSRDLRQFKNQYFAVIIDAQNRLQNTKTVFQLSSSNHPRFTQDRFTLACL